MSFKNKIGLAFTTILTGMALNSNAQVTEQNRDRAKPMDKNNYHTTAYPNYMTPAMMEDSEWIKDIKNTDEYLKQFELVKSDTTRLNSDQMLVNQLLVNKNGDMIAHQLEGKAKGKAFYGHRNQLTIFHPAEYEGKKYLQTTDLLKANNLSEDIIEQRNKIMEQIKAEGQKLKALTPQAQAEVDLIEKMRELYFGFDNARDDGMWKDQPKATKAQPN